MDGSPVLPLPKTCARVTFTVKLSPTRTNAGVKVMVKFGCVSSNVTSADNASKLASETAVSVSDDEVAF